MGSDIHTSVERRKADGAWEFVPWPRGGEDGPFETRVHGVFGFLGDVRNHAGIPPIAARRGVPLDASVAVMEAYEQWGVDGHTHSWVAVRELLAVDYETRLEAPDEPTGEPGGGTRTLREELGRAYFADLAVLARYDMASPTRIVFWFDN